MESFHFEYDEANKILAVRVDPFGRFSRYANGSFTGDRAQDVDVMRGQVEGDPDIADARRVGETAIELTQMRQGVGQQQANVRRPRWVEGLPQPGRPARRR